MSTTVAYLGPEGTFTEAALLDFRERGCFGAEVTALPVSSPSAALNAVHRAQAQFAVVAIENSVDGAVTSTYDALVDAAPGVQIFHETVIDIAFSIMTRPGKKQDEVTTLATHPVAHQQVRRWMSEHMPQAEFLAASSNAAAAKMVAEGKADAAAAPVRAAEIYGLERIADGVADESGARTRFVVVGPTGVPTARSGNDTTLVAFSLRNEPGALVAALQDFSQRGLNLSRISSRPIPSKPGTYVFYADVVGHIDTPEVADSVRSVELRAQEMMFLGSWPSAT